MKTLNTASLENQVFIARNYRAARGRRQVVTPLGTVWNRKGSALGALADQLARGGWTAAITLRATVAQSIICMHTLLSQSANSWPL